MMTELATADVQADHSQTIPPAQHQTSLSRDDTLHSANAGVIVERVGQIKNGCRSEGRQFARELAETINRKQVGVATVFVYEETFGVKDRIHWLIHLRSLDDYPRMVTMGAMDEEFRNTFTKQWIPADKGGGTWDQMFVDGSLRETVMLPQFWGMYGTRVDSKLEATRAAYKGAELVSLPPAQEQTSVPAEQTLNSASAGIILHRSAQLIYDFRSEARQFAREVASALNDRMVGDLSVFLYENAFGRADEIHWLIHMRSLSVYYKLLALHVKDEDVRAMFFEQRIPPERGGGTWARMFVQGSMVDTSLTPQHWGMYATRHGEQQEA